MKRIALKSSLHRKRGATLVELIVTFSLLAIFMASAIAIITPSINIFQNMKYMSYAQSVGEILMEKVTGSICSATKNVVIASDKGSIQLEDGQSSPIYISKNSDGRLVIHYREIKFEGEQTWEAVDWKYDDKAYQSFRIDKLEFEKTKFGNSVRVTLELTNDKYGLSYKTEKVVECYDLEGNITTGPTQPGDDDYYEELDKPTPTPVPTPTPTPTPTPIPSPTPTPTPPSLEENVKDNATSWPQILQETVELYNKTHNGQPSLSQLGYSVPLIVYDHTGVYIIQYESSISYSDAVKNITLEDYSTKNSNVFEIDFSRVLTTADQEVLYGTTVWKAGSYPQKGSVYLCDNKYYARMTWGGQYASTTVNNNDWLLIYSP